MTRLTGQPARRAACAAAVLIVASACGGGQTHAQQVNACKSAMRADFKHALTHPSAPPAQQPDACKGLPPALLRKLAGQIMSGG